MDADASAQYSSQMLQHIAGGREHMPTNSHMHVALCNVQPAKNRQIILIEASTPVMIALDVASHVAGLHGHYICFCRVLLRFEVHVLCRYTLFIPLYPVGMLAEMVLMAKSLPYLKSQKLNSTALPNAVNFGFDYRIFIQVPSPVTAAYCRCGCFCFFCCGCCCCCSN